MKFGQAKIFGPAGLVKSTNPWFSDSFAWSIPIPTDKVPRPPQDSLHDQIGSRDQPIPNLTTSSLTCDPAFSGLLSYETLTHKARRADEKREGRKIPGSQPRRQLCRPFEGHGQTSAKELKKIQLARTGVTLGYVAFPSSSSSSSSSSYICIIIIINSCQNVPSFLSFTTPPRHAPICASTVLGHLFSCSESIAPNRTLHKRPSPASSPRYAWDPKWL